MTRHEGPDSTGGLDLGIVRDTTSGKRNDFAHFYEEWVDFYEKWVDAVERSERRPVPLYLARWKYDLFVAEGLDPDGYAERCGYDGVEIIE